MLEAYQELVNKSKNSWLSFEHKIENTGIFITWREYPKVLHVPVHIHPLHYPASHPSFLNATFLWAFNPFPWWRHHSSVFYVFLHKIFIFFLFLIDLNISSLYLQIEGTSWIVGISFCITYSVFPVSYCCLLSCRKKWRKNWGLT